MKQQNSEVRLGGTQLEKSSAEQARKIARTTLKKSSNCTCTSTIWEACSSWSASRADSDLSPWTSRWPCNQNLKILLQQHVPAPALLFHLYYFKKQRDSTFTSALNCS
jgi:hypothetical protein